MEWFIPGVLSEMQCQYRLTLPASPHVSAELVRPRELPAAVLPAAPVGLLPGVGPGIGSTFGKNKRF